MRSIFCLCAIALVAKCEPVPDPNRGLYAIWAKPEISGALRFLKGDQVRIQWSEVQPAQDRYDFRGLHQQLERVARLGRATTIQLNANRHPEFLSRIVPTFKGGVKRGATDGLFQYWHPAYVKTYTDLLAAFAREIKQSPHRSRVIGVRLNYNAIGTEFLIIRPEERDPAGWTVPEGVTPGPAWTEEIAAGYRRTIVQTFLRNFSPGIRVFLRSGNPAYPSADLEALALAETGKLGIFTTANEIEPRMPTMFPAGKDQPIFIDYCRSGKTVCYGESMADATGRHGSSQDARWCSPEQYNYWRLLSDLNLGFSMIGVYGADLANAGKPEYRAAFDFANRYAGYHASPRVSPGAWIALREGTMRLKGDYTFLMRWLPGVEMKPEQKAGPDDQRFGAWARTLPKGGEAKFALDPEFAASLTGKKVILRVVFLERGAGTFAVRAAGRNFDQALTDSGRWKTAEFPIDRFTLAATADGAHIAIQAADDLTLHMLEVARTE
jgi:hypothetical protein